MPHQHVHNLTPYPLMAEGSSFPFPSVLPQHPMASTSSSSSSYASFRYPRPHATSHPSASFPLSLATVHSPVPPSLLARRRSSCSTVHSVASNSTSASSTESWGNWSTESPPALSRSGSVSSRNGAMDIKTPETVVYPDFEDAITHRKSTPASASASTSTFGSMSDVFDHPSSEDYSNDHNEPAVPISAMKRAGISRPRAKLFVTLAEPSSAPRLQRKQTPLEPFTLGSSGSGLFGAGSRVDTSTTTTTATATAPTSLASTSTANQSTKKTTTTTPTRPKFVRKVTPHPATTPATHLPSPEVKGTKHFVPDLSTLVLNETDEDEAEEELEEELEDDRPRGRSPLPARAFALERPGVGRRFSSVIKEGTVWLAV